MYNWCTLLCVQIVRLLVSYSADVNAVNVEMNTALHVACRTPQLYVVAFYLVLVSTHRSLSDGFYHTMHYSAKHGLAIACRLPVCL